MTCDYKEIDPEDKMSKTLIIHEFHTDGEPFEVSDGIRARVFRVREDAEQVTIEALGGYVDGPGEPGSPTVSQMRLPSGNSRP